MAVIRAKINGEWVDLFGGADEVYVGPNAPSDPSTELWYDTDDSLTPAIVAAQIPFTPVGTIASGDVQSAIAEVATDAAAALAAVPAWIRVNTLPFTNSWADYGAPYGPAYYRKVGDIVSLRGLINLGSPVTAAICTLPVGYRPAYQPIFTVQCNLGTAEIRVDGNGVVSSPWQSAGSSATAWLSLTGITFSTT